MKKIKNILTLKNDLTKIKKMQEFINSTDIGNCLNTEKKEVKHKEDNLIKIEKIYETVEKVNNDSNLKFKVFLKIEKNESIFVMLVIISENLYPYDNLKIKNVEFYKNEEEMIYSIFDEQIGIKINKKIYKKTFLEIQKQTLIDDFFRADNLNIVSKKDNIMNFSSVEEFLENLIKNKEKLEKFLKILKINFLISLNNRL